jgi:hypothetical protein
MSVRKIWIGAYVTGVLALRALPALSQTPIETAMREAAGPAAKCFRDWSGSKCSMEANFGYLQSGEGNLLFAFINYEDGEYKDFLPRLITLVSKFGFSTNQVSDCIEKVRGPNKPMANLHSEVVVLEKLLQCEDSNFHLNITVKKNNRF